MRKGCTFASLFRGTPLIKRENIEKNCNDRSSTRDGRCLAAAI